MAVVPHVSLYCTSRGRAYVGTKVQYAMHGALGAPSIKWATTVPYSAPAGAANNSRNQTALTSKGPEQIVLSCHVLPNTQVT